MLSTQYNNSVHNNEADKWQEGVHTARPAQQIQFTQPVQQTASKENVSVAKSLEKPASLQDEGMFGSELFAMGLDMIFGGVAGISCDTMMDAVEVYDEFVQDRFGRPQMQQVKAPQPDPRLWVPSQPGMQMAA